MHYTYSYLQLPCPEHVRLSACVLVLLNESILRALRRAASLGVASGLFRRHYFGFVVQIMMTVICAYILSQQWFCRNVNNNPLLAGKKIAPLGKLKRLRMLQILRSNVMKGQPQQADRIPSLVLHKPALRSGRLLNLELCWCTSGL